MSQALETSPTSSPLPAPGTPLAPYPGSHNMPRWNVAELIEAPQWQWKKIFTLLGPALLMGGAAIGGGEWLTGPAVTARYGGALMWLAALSILGQVVYNTEISRYTLYSGEPIFTGKFRTLPGPTFWVWIYLVLDFGSLFPYLASSAATPAAAVILGHVPRADVPGEVFLLRALGVGVFLLAFVPLIFGGKIYNALKTIMSIKIVVVLGFLLVLGIFFTDRATWVDIFTGFLKVGNVPIQRGEDANGNGVLDEGEDWDGDRRLDGVEQITMSLDTNGDGQKDAFDFNGDGRPDLLEPDFLRPGIAGTKATVDTNGDGKADALDFDGDGKADPADTVFARVDRDGDGMPETVYTIADLKRNKDGKLYLDIDGSGTCDGDNVDNVFAALLAGRPLDIELGMIAYLAAFAAIAGSGGLTNTPTSNYTRDQGWGMGHHVGAIPSLVGGHNLSLSHVGTVFQVTPEVLPRWRAWYRHVLRDQLLVWMPACFLGVALPSLLSVEFLPRGTAADEWTSAAMTAGGVESHVTEDLTSAFGIEGARTLGRTCWYMTLLCGFLVLAPSMASTVDGFVRRWVDVFWTASRFLRSLPSDRIKYVYFTVLCGYMIFGLTMLTVVGKPEQLLKISTNIMNFALGFSCLHVLVLNSVLLPREIRPNWFIRIALLCAGVFFLTLASLTTLKQFELI